MTFWVIAAGLTALAMLTALWPLFRPASSSQAPTRADYDVEVYGAQLSELQGDVERGAIAPEEAETARAEIGRRLLRADGRAKAARSTLEPRRRRSAAAVAFVALVLPAVSAGLYVRLGSAGLPDRPLAARMAESQAVAEDFRRLVAQAEERLRSNPEDGRGWDVLAPIYLRMERAGDAETAFRNAIRILGPSAEREAGLGEALTRLAGGEVTDEARAAFERAVAFQEAYLPAHFFLALDLSQEGRFPEAAAAWQQLIERSPEGAPWLQIAEAGLADARQRSGEGAIAAAPAPGPSSADMAAAAEMPQAERQAMIEGMVSQLAERLKTAPNDVEGWKRLIRSYSVLGESDKARDALRQASAAFRKGSGESGEIAALGRELGLSEAEEMR